MLREVFLTNHLASTDNKTKTTNTPEPTVEYNTATSIPNNRQYTMNTHKKIVGYIDRTDRTLFMICLPQGDLATVLYRSTHRNSALSGGPFEGFPSPSLTTKVFLIPWGGSSSLSSVKRQKIILMLTLYNNKNMWSVSIAAFTSSILAALQSSSFVCTTVELVSGF